MRKTVDVPSTEPLGSEESDLLVHLALVEMRKADRGEKHDRGPIDHLWRMISAGSLADHSTVHWATIVAQRVVAMVLEDDSPSYEIENLHDILLKERDRRAITAIGLTNQRSNKFIIERELELYLHFEEFRTEPSKSLIARATKYLQQRGHFHGVRWLPAQHKVRRAWNRLLKKDGKKS